MHGLKTPDVSRSLPEDFDTAWGFAFSDSTQAEDGINLMEDCRPLANGPGVRTPAGTYYYGGVNHGNGLGEYVRVKDCVMAETSLIDEHQESKLQNMYQFDENGSDDEGDPEGLVEAFGMFTEDEGDDDLDIPM